MISTVNVGQPNWRFKTVPEFVGTCISIAVNSYGRYSKWRFSRVSERVETCKPLISIVLHVKHVVFSLLLKKCKTMSYRIFRDRAFALVFKDRGPAYLAAIDQHIIDGT